MTSIGGSSNVPPPPPPPPVDKLAQASGEAKKAEASRQNQEEAAKVTISEAGRAAISNVNPPEQAAKPEAAPQTEAPNAIDPALLNRSGAPPAQAQQGANNGVKDLLR